MCVCAHYCTCFDEDKIAYSITIIIRPVLIAGSFVSGFGFWIFGLCRFAKFHGECTFPYRTEVSSNFPLTFRYREGFWVSGVRVQPELDVPGHSKSW